MIKWLRNILRSVLRRVRGGSVVEEIVKCETPPPEPEYKPNRKERRAISVYERARRRHDKFVQPGGERPKPVARGPSPRCKKTEVVQVAQPDDGLIIVDKHHETGIDVLYKESEMYGEFNFRDTVLSQLDYYFMYLKRMRYRDPDAYSLYRQIGGIVTTYSATGVDRYDRATSEQGKKILTASDWFCKNRPAFGCIAYAASPQGEKLERDASATSKTKTMWLPKFLYFQKYDQPPPELQPTSGGDIYTLTVWWDQPFNNRFTRNMGKKGGVPQSFGIFVSHDGKILRALKSIETRYMGDIPSRQWRIPHEMEEWAKQHKISVQTFLVNTFLGAMEAYEQSGWSMVRVEVTKGDMSAVIGVSVRRMAYFFKDRDYVLDEHGKRSRIFHIVRAHERESRGQKTSVRLHFRGEREFIWAGYGVSITVPGRDHFMISEFDIGTTDEYWLEKKSLGVHSEQLGRDLRSWTKSGLGAILKEKRR